jgi:hypothetical protein
MRETLRARGAERRLSSERRPTALKKSQQQHLRDGMNSHTAKNGQMKAVNEKALSAELLQRFYS